MNFGIRYIQIIVNMSIRYFEPKKIGKNSTFLFNPKNESDCEFRKNQ